MKNAGEGSNAMTIYVVVCFVLAAAAMVAYKYNNDRREELRGEYENLTGKYADISGALSPNIADYYRKVKSGDIRPADKEKRDNTHVNLSSVAKLLNINEGTGADDRLDIGLPRAEKKKAGTTEYFEYSVDVKLKNVTQSEWAAFMSNALVHKDLGVSEYARIETLELNRVESRYAKIELVANNGGKWQDRSLWNARLVFVWFGPKE